MKSIYLDHAAATPIDSSVLKRMQPYLSDNFYNPSATYLAAKAVAKDIELARASVAKILGARTPEIVFTAGGTEANNLAIHGVMQGNSSGNIVVSAIEHDSILLPAGKYECRVVPVSRNGMVDLETLEKLIDENTRLVSIMYANNEVGTVQPIKEIAAIIARKRALRTAPLYFHTDAAQAGNYLHLQVAKLGVDLMTINGGKLYGPKQSGALYVRTGTPVQAQILGGGQENSMRSGTENVAGIVGFAHALQLAQQLKISEVLRLKQLQTLFYDLMTRHVPQAVRTTSSTQMLPNNIHFVVPGHDNERLLMQLDEQGIQCAAGSACSASSEEPSHVLKAMGCSDKQAQSSLRLTMGRQTAESDIRKVVATLATLV